MGHLFGILDRGMLFSISSPVLSPNLFLFLTVVSLHWVCRGKMVGSHLHLDCTCTGWSDWSPPSLPFPSLPPFAAVSSLPISHVMHDIPSLSLSLSLSLFFLCLCLRIILLLVS